MATGNDIIIKGGSVAIEFNESIFAGKNGKYGNRQKTIDSVEITDDTGRVQIINVSGSGKCTIRINTR